MADPTIYNPVPAFRLPILGQLPAPMVSPGPGMVNAGLRQAAAPVAATVPLTPAPLGVVNPPPAAATAAPPALPVGPVNYDRTRLARAGVGADGGQLVNLPGAGTPSPVVAPPAGGSITNPGASISAAFDAQNARARSFMDSALSYINDGKDIFDRATRGRAISGILGAVMGPNNQGQVTGQGIDSYNTNLANIQDTNTSAAAQNYTADQGVVGHNIAADATRYVSDATAQPIGQNTQYNMGMPVSSQTVYGTRGSGFSPLTTRPTYSQWLSHAREANPGASDDALQALYKKNYGGQ
jgi:hypothetical protein